jgi:hypothetical protein
MVKRLNFPESIVPRVALMVEHADKLPALTALAASPGIKPNQLAKAFAAKAGLSFPDARKILTQIMGFTQLRLNTGATAANIFDGLTESLKEHPEYYKSLPLEKWEAARPAIETAIAPGNPIGIVQKSNKLQFEHQNLLHSIKILTDVRPVFDEAARSLDHMVIGFVLELEFDGRMDDLEKLFVALDATDIAKLKSECERAETKVQTLKESLKSVGRPISVAGDDEDE